MMKHWIVAMRLRTLPLAISGIVLASLLAYSKNFFKWEITLLATLTAILLQITSNFANDVGDFQNGADNDNRVGPKRGVQSGHISPTQMKWAMVITSFLSFVSGITLLLMAHISREIFQFLLVTGLLAIVAAITYTFGKKAYGYIGLGDLSVFIFFGFASVYGTYILHSQQHDYSIILPAAACGLFSVAVLNLNNMRDVENDKQVGKNTLVVRIGLRNAKIYHMSLYSIACLCILLYHFYAVDVFYRNIGSILLAFFLLFRTAIHVWKSEPQQMDQYMKPTALRAFAACVFIGLAYVL